tara:strand:- start:2665 stop:3558 length:894 start_codon:yes stop_codon:yes gene_type:complete
MSNTKPTLQELEVWASKLEASESYKVLRKVAEPKREKVRKNDELRYAMIVDTETTGLDLRTDEVIELGFILVAYKDQKIKYIKDLGNEMREPDRKISEEVQHLTGITPEMVKGKSLSRETVLGALSLANIVIAHNAAFDRPICERLLPEFANKPWACSLTEVPWSKYGFESAKLKYLLLENGYFFEGHRALDDCAALEVLLNQTSPNGLSYFEELMESARQPSFSFRVQAPYDLRQTMRDFGFRWSRFEGRTGGEWLKTVKSKDFEFERIRIERMNAKGVRLDYMEQDAFSRYRIQP